MKPTLTTQKYSRKSTRNTIVVINRNEQKIITIAIKNR